MDQVLKDFFSALNQEEGSVLSILIGDNLGVWLKCAISELDWCYYNFEKIESPSVEQQEYLYIMKLGVARLIYLSLDSRDSFDAPVVTFKRDERFSFSVLKLIHFLGSIQHGRRVAQAISLGVGEIEKKGAKEFSFRLYDRLVDDEYYERAVLQHYRNESRKLFEGITRIKAWEMLEEDVRGKIHELVYPFENYFIGYDADPLLDEYFFALAYKEVQLWEGFDTFHYAEKFGGIRFQSYILALVFMVSNSMKHECFAEALVKKCPSIRLEDVLTVSLNTDEYLESMKDAINYFGSNFESFERVTLEEVRRIFDVLSCGRKSRELLSAPGAPLPLIVQCSESGFIRFLSGAQDESVRFLLESLRYNFKKDYDGNQVRREISLQRAIKRVLDGAVSGVEYRENIKVKIDGKIRTDVDLVLLEKSSGIIVLCQLKYQEMYGADLHAKRTRIERLKTQVKDWMDVLDEWLSLVGSDGLRGALRLPKSFPDPLIYRMVVSKHYSYPLRDIVSGSEVLYANWAQFFNANELLKNNGAQAGLADLIEIFKDNQELAGTQEYLPEPERRWRVNDLSFITYQA